MWKQRKQCEIYNLHWIWIEGEKQQLICLFYMYINAFVNNHFIKLSLRYMYGIDSW